MTSFAEHATRGNLTVKGKRASAHQAEMMALIATRTRAKGGDLESGAGAIATAIQESGVSNLNYGDRDSRGLYQQRPSMGWGTIAQITTPSYAIDKFLSIYLPYRKQGLGWLQASHKTQRSAHASAPAKWYPEASRAASYFTGGGGGGAGDSVGTTGEGGSYTEVRDQPYEYSRGTADKKEDSWTAIGRLAEEVSWRAFTRGTGELWFVTEEWLAKQPAKYRLSETSRGVLSLNFEFETRKEAAEANVRVVLGRYALTPGDVVELFDEGPADGKWLVASTRRDLFSVTMDIQLKRAGVRLLEPAPEKVTTTVNVAGTSQEQTNPDLGSLNNQAAKCYAAAQAMSGWGIPYSISHRTLIARPPSADCSSSCCWALWQAGIPLPGGVGAGKWAPVSGAFLNWGQAGPGKFFTIMTNAGHIWIRWNGIGTAWRFDTSSYGTPGNGPRQRGTPRPTSGFVQRHWAGL